MMLPEDQLATRLEQTIQLLGPGLWNRHRAQHLDSEHRVKAAFCDSMLLEDVALLHPAGD